MGWHGMSCLGVWRTLMLQTCRSSPLLAAASPMQTCEDTSLSHSLDSSKVLLIGMSLLSFLIRA